MDIQHGQVLLRVNFCLDRHRFVWYHMYSEKTNEVNMSYQFTVYPNPEFDFDLLPRFSEDHGVSYSIKNIMEDDDLNEVYVVTFSSENIDYLEEVSDELNFLNQTKIV